MASQLCLYFKVWRKLATVVIDEQKVLRGPKKKRRYGQSDNISEVDIAEL